MVVPIHLPDIYRYMYISGHVSRTLTAHAHTHTHMVTSLAMMEACSCILFDLSVSPRFSKQVPRYPVRVFVYIRGKVYGAF